MSTGLTTDNVVVLTLEPSAPAPIWQTLVTGALILVAAAALAWWRGQGRGPRRAKRRTRIAAAALAGSAGAMALMVASARATPDVDGFRLGRYGFSVELTMLGHFLGYLLLAGMLAGTGDLLFDALRPHRNRFWLILGTPLFAIFLIATLSLTGWFDLFALPRGIEQAIFVVPALAAALIWWAWLPLPHQEVADIFE